VTATTNKNMDFCANYCIKTLAALSLSTEEVTSYKNLNKAVYQVIIQYNGVKKTFYLRKKMSVDALKTLISQWEFYTRSFTVQSGLDETNGNNDPNIRIQVKYLLDSNGKYVLDFRGDRESIFQIHDFNPSRIDGRAFDYNEPIAINFLSSEKRAAAFSWQDKRTLAQIEKMTGYTVKPRGVISQFKHGGFVVYQRDGHGLVAALTDLGTMDWNSAKTVCDELILNGYSDWHLPSKEQLNAFYVNLKQIGVGGFVDSSYWSSTEGDSDDAWLRSFISGGGFQNYYYKYYKGNVRAVRAF
jgi:hypothetical protein